MNNINWSAAPEGYPIWVEAIDKPFGLNLSGWFKLQEFYVGKDSFSWPKSAEGVHFTAHRKPVTSYTVHWTGYYGVCRENQFDTLSEAWYWAVYVEEHGGQSVSIIDSNGVEVNLGDTPTATEQVPPIHEDCRDPVQRIVGKTLLGAAVSRDELDILVGAGALREADRDLYFKIMRPD